MEEAQTDAPPRVPVWRLLGIAAMILALYLALTWVSDDVELQPLLLGAALVGGAAVGALVARIEPASAPARGRRTSFVVGGAAYEWVRARRKAS